MEITVILCTYNENISILQRSVESILNQTFKDFEFIIILDNPKNESSIEFLRNKSLLDSRIKLIINSNNIGLTKSLNVGLNLANGKYIARMDADDYAYKDRFQKQYAFMELYPEIILCGGSILQINSLGKEIKNIKFPKTNKEIKHHLLIENCMCHPTFFFRNETIKSKGILYNENLKYSQDYEFVLECSNHGKLHNLEETLLKYQISGEQISRKKIGEQEYFQKKILTKYYEKNFKIQSFRDLSKFIKASSDSNLNSFLILGYCKTNKKYFKLLTYLFFGKVSVVSTFSILKSQFSVELKKILFQNKY